MELNNDDLDNDLDLAQAKILGICPSCGSKNSHEGCIRNTEEILVDYHYSLRVDYDEESKSVTVSTYPKDDDKMSGVPTSLAAKFRAKCCKSDYDTLIESINHMQKSRTTVTLEW